MRADETTKEKAPWSDSCTRQRVAGFTSRRPDYRLATTLLEVLSCDVAGVKDGRAKLSPYLVSWANLSYEVAEWGRAAVRAWSALLAELGMEIRRAS